jgi:predicted nucleic acid-binding protein
MNSVFLDTVGLLAIWDDTDQWHRLASIAYATIRRGPVEVLTTTFVLAECANAAARRPYRLSPDRMRERLEKSGRLIFPTEEDWDNAWMAYREGQAGAAGIVDQLSFIVMKRLGVSRAFTNDKHFRAAGLEPMF